MEGAGNFVPYVGSMVIPPENRGIRGFPYLSMPRRVSGRSGEPGRTLRRLGAAA